MYAEPAEHKIKSSSTRHTFLVGHGSTQKNEHIDSKHTASINVRHGRGYQLDRASPLSPTVDSGVRFSRALAELSYSKTIRGG